MDPHRHREVAVAAGQRGGRRSQSRQTWAVVRYLSLDWIDAVAGNAACDERLGSLAGEHEIGFTQVVSGGPEGDVTYHLQVANGVVGFGSGPAEPEHVRMEQTWATAVAVATGRLNAQQAFVNGHIRLHGNQQRLLDAQPIFGALDTVFTKVREQTTYE